MQELEQALQGAVSSRSEQQGQQSNSQLGSEGESTDDSGMPLVKHLINQGYLKDSPKWLSAKGFNMIGGRILSDVMKALKAGEYGRTNP